MALKGVDPSSNLTVRSGKDPIDKAFNQALDKGTLSISGSDRLALSTGPGKPSFDVTCSNGKIYVSQSGSDHKPVLLRPKELQALEKRLATWKPSEDWRQQKIDNQNRAAWTNAAQSALSGKPVQLPAIDLPRQWSTQKMTFDGQAALGVVDLRAEEARAAKPGSANWHFPMTVTKLDADRVKIKLTQPEGAIPRADVRSLKLGAKLDPEPQLPPISPELAEKLDAIERVMHPPQFLGAASSTSEIDLSKPEGRTAYQKIQSPAFTQKVIELEQKGMSFNDAVSLLLRPTTQF